MIRRRRGLRLLLLTFFAAAACFLIPACAPERATKTSNGETIVRLRFWHAWGGHEGKYLDSLVKEFNDTHPAIQVDSSFFNIGDKLLAAIAGGKPPDIATVWSFMIAPMGESGCFLPLEDHLRAAGIGEQDFLPGVWTHGVPGKHRWGMPTTLNTFAIYFNRRLAVEAGLDPEHPPRTISELEEWSRRLTRRDNSGRVSQIGFVPNDPAIWMWNFGGAAFDPHASAFTLDRPENIRALAWMKSMYEQIGGMDAFRRAEAAFGKLDSPQHPLFTGRQAMREDGQWIVQFFHEYAPDVEYGIFPFPSAVPGQEGVAPIDGSFWSIPVGTKHPEEAWTFLRWLTAPEQSARFCATLKNIPPLRATLARPEFAEARRDPKFEFFVRLVAEGHTRAVPETLVGEQFQEEMDQGVRSVLSGAVSPEEYLGNLNRTMNAELARQKTLLGVSK